MTEEQKGCTFMKLFFILCGITFIYHFREPIMVFMDLLMNILKYIAQLGFGVASLLFCIALVHIFIKSFRPLFK